MAAEKERTAYCLRMKEPCRREGGGSSAGSARGTAMGLAPSQPFSVQPNSQLEEVANQGCIAGRRCSARLTRCVPL
ncbi:hypothetical protein GN956_G1280 [Arapaima gigas]